MGGAPSLALGLALARPEQAVVVLDGDASLLMQLGGLVTVAGQQPRNLHHFVMHNGTQFTGLSNLDIAGPRPVDFCQVAEGAGYARVYAIDDAADLAQRLPAILAVPGPVFVALAIEPDAPTFSAEQVVQIVALACEPPPDSDRPVSHWTPRELAEEAVTRHIVPTISPRSVGRFLKRGPTPAPFEPLLVDLGAG